MQQLQKPRAKSRSACDPSDRDVYEQDGQRRPSTSRAVSERAEALLTKLREEVGP